MPTRPSGHSITADRADYLLRDANYTLRRYAKAGRNPIMILGPPGSGKTALVRQFFETQKKRRVRWLHDPIASWNTDSLPNDLMDALRAKVSAVVIDEFDRLRGGDISHLLQLVAGRPDVQLFLIGVNSLDPEALKAFQDAAVITLDAFRFDEFLDVVRQMHPGGPELSKDYLKQLFDKFHGNPRMLTAALQARSVGLITDEDTLLESISEFQASGLIGPNGRPIREHSGQEKRIIVDVSAVNSEVLRLLDNQPNLLWQVPSRRFEELVAEILHKQGYEVELTPASADGGFDMYAARKDGLGKFLYLVECKRYTPPNKVGVEIVRALNGVVQAKQATAGAIVTSSYFTSGAKDFQREQEHRMNLHDYIVLRRWVSDYTNANAN